MPLERRIGQTRQQEGHLGSNPSTGRFWLGDLGRVTLTIPSIPLFLHRYNEYNEYQHQKFTIRAEWS